MPVVIVAVVAEERNVGIAQDAKLKPKEALKYAVTRVDVSAAIAIGAVKERQNVKREA